MTASGTAVSSLGDGTTSFNTQSGRSGISAPAAERGRRARRPACRSGRGPRPAPRRERAGRGPAEVELERPVVLQVRDRDTDQRQAARRSRGSSEASAQARSEDGRGLGRRPREGARAGRARESAKRTRRTTVARRAAARMRRVTRSTSPRRDRVELVRRPRAPAQRPLRPDRAPPPPAAHRRGSRLWASACRCRPDRVPEQPPASPRRARRPRRPSRSPRSRSCRAVTGPTPHSRSTGSGCRNASSPPSGTTSRPSGFATPLATFARNFVRATPTVIGSPTCSRTSRRRRRAISRGVPAIRRDRGRRETPRRSRAPPPAGSCRGRPRNLLAGLGVRRHARPHDDRVRAEPRACRPPIAVRTPQALPRSSRRAPHRRRRSPGGRGGRVVTLLHRGEERVEVGVEDRCLGWHAKNCPMRSAGAHSAPGCGTASGRSRRKRG